MTTTFDSKQQIVFTINTEINRHNGASIHTDQIMWFVTRPTFCYFCLSLIVVPASCLLVAANGLDSHGSGSYKSTAIFNVYTNLCGPLLCKTAEIDQLTVNLTLPAICNNCFCSKDCIVSGTCCIDYALKLPDQVCTDDLIYQYSVGSSNSIKRSYKMVKSCPTFFEDYETSNKCSNQTSYRDKITSLPVTSRVNHITYANVHCATCHLEEEIENWNVKFHCTVETDFNSFTSVKEIFDAALINKCDLTAKVNSPDVFIKECKYNPHIAIRSCNKTGTWLNQSDALEEACHGIDQPIGMFQNIFCYMCNPPTGAMDVIMHCPLESPHYHDCVHSPIDPNTYPYKNVFSYLGHVNNNGEFIQNIEYRNITKGRRHDYFVFMRYCETHFVPGIQYVEIEGYNPYNYDYYYDDDDDTVVPFARQWQYHISCPNFEVFSMFLTREQLHNESIGRNCNFQQQQQDFELICYHKTDLIRNCSTNFSEDYVEMQLIRACSYVEDPNLLAYKEYYNIFCYYCNNLEFKYHMCQISMNEAYPVYDLNPRRCARTLGTTLSFEKVFCFVCSNEKKIDIGYRDIFALASYSDSSVSESVKSCSSNQMFDTKSVRNSLAFFIPLTRLVYHEYGIHHLCYTTFRFDFFYV